ncbi:MAG: bifunctional ADP-dependent NAD(P)H-hydrate dehydratase/NAD(P)H-hydrate epimerase [Treponema sp.]|jgi:NAD(P)H-hydrate epimerase|nr:bifunctional ADP-dependent NAD(P)H-hydrate dehydratase/NAD(P)H-hydrate epimerase [Treponema sp.]
MRLVSSRTAAFIDDEASRSWGLSPFALVEAAGRACAESLVKSDVFKKSRLPQKEKPVPVLVMAGPGNNGADALVMLRALLLKGFCREKTSAVFLSRDAGEETSPRSQAITAVTAMGVAVYLWNDTDLFTREGIVKNAGLVIDGIAGTGLTGPLRGIPLEMVQSLNILPPGPLVVSIDVPSGCGDDFTPGSPVLRSGLTLAIEPVKKAIYTPALRSFCGTVVPVTGVFPKQLLALCDDGDSGPAETSSPERKPDPGRNSAGEKTSSFLFGWEDARTLVPAIPPDAYKYSRGLVEIHACDYGSCGAGRIAASGASAVGVGLVRLVVDDELYPILASGADGVMVVPVSKAGGIAAASETRFKPDALLLGPGWGRDKRRLETLERAFAEEAGGVPLVLDADAIILAKEYFTLRGEPPRFNGLTILTPHPGELEVLSGVEKETLLAKPRLVAELACKLNAVLVFKSHVTILASPGPGSLAYVDGMIPALAAGGSGDLLAGFCAGLAARLCAGAENRLSTDSLFSAAVAAVALLMETGRRRKAVFSDPAELAGLSSRIAGSAWLAKGAF